MKWVSALCALALALPILAQDFEGFSPPQPADFEAFQKAYPTVCVGDPSVTIANPESHTVAGFSFELSGATATLRRTGESPHPGEVRLGVLSGIKEFDKATQKALDLFLGEFEKAGVDAVLVGGDSAYTSKDLKALFLRLGATKLPVLAISGNNESRTHFNRAVLEAWRVHKNVLNMNLVRRVDGTGFDVVSLPGYHLKQFASASATCIHKAEQVVALKEVAVEKDDPVVLLAHGPPLQAGKHGLDWIPDAGNVGDEHLANAIKNAGIRFGIHGHILEAGARATDRTGKKTVPQNKFRKELFVNPGQANSLPYSLTLGWISYGTAAILTLKDGKGAWKLLKSPQPESYTE